MKVSNFGYKPNQNFHIYFRTCSLNQLACFEKMHYPSFFHELAKRTIEHSLKIRFTMILRFVRESVFEFVCEEFNTYFILACNCCSFD